MKVSEIVGGDPFTVQVRAFDVGWTTPPDVGVELVLEWHDDRVLTRLGDEAIALTGATTSDTTLLLELAAGALPVVTYVAKSRRDRLVIEARRLPREMKLNDPLEFGLDDRAIDDLERRHGVRGTVADAARWLEERLFLPPRPGDDPEGRRLVVATDDSGRPDAFRVFGRRLAIDVRRIEDRLRIERVAKGGQVGKQKLTLMHLRVRIVDATQAAAVTSAARTALDEAVADGSSYLSIWQAYHDLERRQVMRKAGAFGSLPYSRCEPRRDGGYRFQLDNVDDAVARVRSLGNAERFELVARDTGVIDEQDSETYGRRRAARERLFRGKVVDVALAGGTVDLVPGDDDEVPSPPERGFLGLSTIGDEVRLERRQEAEQALRTGRCEIPQLGLIMEGQLPRAHRMPRRSPMSPSVTELFGDSRPTQRQIEAIDRALNTPDICLIQGPPGTGKTRVITAIERRLAELADEGMERSHRVLVTAAQHDAVDNVAKRTEVFGLPAAKVGKRGGSDGGGVDLVQAFADRRAEDLRAQLTDPPQVERLSKARGMVIFACRTPAKPSEQARRLHDVVATLGGLVEPSLADRVRAHAAALTKPAGGGDPEQRELQLKAARGIRVEPAPFSDDGPLRAAKALRVLDEVLSADERGFLARCAEVEFEVVPPWLEEGRALREALIDRLTEPTEPELPTLDEETQNLLLDVLADVEARLEQRREGEEAAVAAFLDDLEHDPAEVRRTLEHYTVVLASTLQQAAGKDMRRLRNVTQGNAVFDSVIVDEAARAHPLDLFIPMSMARRRVVLVGDHRQLPHLLEPDVERELRDGVDEGTVEAQSLRAVRESLFKRLWVILRQLEERDGIARTVTLDAQYRMHPVLGDFVSRNFYEVHEGDEIRIESPRPAEDFRHSLPGYEKDGKPCVAAWLDVPAHRGVEVRGASKSRPAEARAIARELGRLIDHDSTLTFGVITFYSAQVDELGRAMIKEGLAERTSELPGWRIADRWARAGDDAGRPKERLRVGTVDAFQGMEFDVVFLSVTRCNDLPSATDEHHRRKYGHLMLPNRLCVAMSRQERLLIVAGDRRFVEEAEPLGPLRDYLALCRGEHGVLV